MYYVSIYFFLPCYRLSAKNTYTFFTLELLFYQMFTTRQSTKRFFFLLLELIRVNVSWNNVMLTYSGRLILEKFPSAVSCIENITKVRIGFFFCLPRIGVETSAKRQIDDRFRTGRQRYSDDDNDAPPPRSLTLELHTCTRVPLMTVRGLPVVFFPRYQFFTLFSVFF